jgi:serine phosphatase RsbU (regulator of sigma subunit)
VAGGSWLVLVPVTERGDAIGLLELTLSREPDRATVDYLTAAAHALAYVLVASRRHTDLFEWAQRDVPFTLEAEIQRRLLPSSYTIEGGPFTIAGWLEPAAKAGGDTFDYSIDREYLYVSITDAMGHMTKAALLATLTVAALRNTRRMTSSPSGQANAANRALLQAAEPDQFVTGQVLRLRLEDGDLEIVNAGHPPPYLLRKGTAATVTLSAGLPFGISSDDYVSEHLQLEPGDRLLLVTDGFLERNAQTLSVVEALEATADQHPREVVRQLAVQVLDATQGNLRDDATALCLDWFGGEIHREAIGGATRSRATAP